MLFSPTDVSEPAGWNTWTNPKLMHHHQRQSFRQSSSMDPFSQNSFLQKSESNIWPPLNVPPPNMPPLNMPPPNMPPTNIPPPNVSLSGSMGANSNYAGISSQLDVNSLPGIDINVDVMPTPLDATQRKSLPAWIR